MIPFRNTWPYEMMEGQLYVQECPYCGQGPVLLPLKAKELDDIRGMRKKRLIVFPCCHTPMQIVDADDDYLLSSKPVRKV
ncbi:hypothetical protein ACFQWB_08505 [Paenibacillus thermoaerophilus]|uniref:Uncharacterized protein n=1 Tax=Paenibacillus thermoaerophilus TaxID=1215385 RepID=A0ABW2V1E3_9BACL|nr:hypothetical protein [Paenibacillus thermoaerophilus]TMV18509.1 hypothetical protein FE781_03600 [Paenibacillus thermoaerophilus]